MTYQSERTGLPEETVADRSPGGRRLDDESGPDVAPSQHKTLHVKEKLRDYVRTEPERSALAAVAAGAVLTGLLRYVVKRKRARNPESPSR